MKPIIAIVPKTGESEKEERKFCYALPRFIEAISTAGGIPIILNNLEGTFEREDLTEILQRVDGVLFSGGGDIDPKFYGEEKLACCGEIPTERDDLEIPLMEEAIRLHKPVMGVCRGFQVLNTVLGGSLYQDLKTQHQSSTAVEHRYEKHEDHIRAVHTVNVIPNTPLAQFSDGAEKIGVNSIHHQAVKKLAEPLCTMAIADDGVIESAYVPGEKFVMGFQWHPEYLKEHDKVAQNIFAAFVNACSQK